MGRTKGKKPSAECKPADRPKVERDFADALPWLPAFFVGLALLVQFSHMMVEIHTLDEGVAASSAWRMLRGEVPYRDFFTITTPLSFYVTAAAFKVAGVSLAVERAVGMVWGVFLALGVWWMARKAVPGALYAALPVAFLCQAGVGIWPFPSHHWTAAVFSLASLLCAWRAGTEGTPRWTFSAGVAASLAAWSLQDQGAFLYVGTAAFYLPWVARGNRLRATAAWLGGALAGGLPLLLLLAVQGALPDLWYDLVVFPLTVYRKYESNRPGLFFPLQEIFLQWASGAWRASPLYNLAVSLTSLSIYLSAILAPWVLLLGWWKRWDEPWRRGLVAAGVLAFLFPAYRRWAPINIMWATALPAIACAWGLSMWARATPRRRWLPSGAAGTLLVCFAFVGLYRVGRALPWSGLNAMRSPAGTLYTHGPGKAQELQELVDAVERAVPPGEPLMPREHGLINFLVQRPNPTRYDFFTPPIYTTPTQTRQAIRALEEKRVRFVTTPTREPDPDDPFAPYLMDHFAPVWYNRAFVLWERTADRPSPPQAGTADPAPPEGPPPKTP